MTLFLRRNAYTVYEIDEVYVGALTLIISFIIGRIARNVIIKLCEKRKLNADNATLNVRGGDGQLILTMSDQQDENVGFTLLDQQDKLFEDVISERELANAIFACIKNDKHYFIKNSQLRKIIFSLVEVKLKKHSLILSPKLLRFLAHKIRIRDRSLLERATELFRSHLIENVPRVNFFIFANLMGGLLLSQLQAIKESILYGIIYFAITTDLSQSIYPCENYFEEIAVQDKSMHLISSSENGHCLVTNLDQDKDNINLMIPNNSGKSSLSIKPRIKTPDGVTLCEVELKPRNTLRGMQKIPVSDNVCVKELTKPKIESPKYVRSKKRLQVMTLEKMLAKDKTMQALKLDGITIEGEGDKGLADKAFQKTRFKILFDDGVAHMLE